MENNYILIIFLLVGFTMRLSYMLVYEEMPFYLGNIIRHIFGVRYWKSMKYVETTGTTVREFLTLKQVVQHQKEDNLSKYSTFATHSLSNVFMCFWCNSVWTSALGVILYVTVPNVFIVLGLCLTSSMISIIISEKIMKG